MENHRAQYNDLMGDVRSSEQKGDYFEAVRLALSSWKHVDGMMQYERRYQDREFSSIEAVDVILKHAPLLFDFQALDEVESLLKTQRRIERNTSDDLADRLARARMLMWDAHRMWDHLERHSKANQRELRRALGSDQHRWRSLAETWEEMGLISRKPEAGSHRLSLSTRMSEVILGKCSSCGVVVQAAKSKFLAERTCPKCITRVLFVILARQPDSDTKE